MHKTKGFRAAAPVAMQLVEPMEYQSSEPGLSPCMNTFFSFYLENNLSFMVSDE